MRRDKPFSWRNLYIVAGASIESKTRLVTPYNCHRYDKSLANDD